MKVLANFKQQGVYYPGELRAVDGRKCTVHYDDGDVEENVSTSQDILLPMQPTKKTSLRSGTLVLVRYSTPQHCYEVGMVEQTRKDNVTVKILGEDNKSETVARNKVTVGELG